MSRHSRSQLALGIILILIGVWFFAEKTIPSLSDFADQYIRWPFTLVWIGALIFLIGLLTGNPGMAVPAVIVAGIGGIFYYNDTYARRAGRMGLHVDAHPRLRGGWIHHCRSVGR